MVVCRSTVLPLTTVEHVLGCTCRRHYPIHDSHLLLLVRHGIVGLQTGSRSIRGETSIVILNVQVLLGTHDSRIVDQGLVLLSNIDTIVALIQR